MSCPAPHPFDEALALQRAGDGRFTGVMSQGYWNMAGPFGGMTAAILLKAVTLHPDLKGRPLSQTVNFCAAISADPFELETVLERDGRSTQHWRVTLRQNDSVAANATVVTGPHRDTWSSQPAAAPALRPHESLEAFDTAGRSGWFGRYEMRFDGGAPTLSGPAGASGDGQTRAWLRDEPPRPLDYPALASLADAFIPRVFLMRGVPGPAATVTLTTYFLASESELAAQGARPIAGVATPRAIKHGFHDQSAELWGDDGNLLAVSHQLVWFKD
ncbi:MAG: thioesterase family protein [Caulobacteraceae bacterium]|nr:thioesterase family protein [Caulobacteraceae bacterium]